MGPIWTTPDIEAYVKMKAGPFFGFGYGKLKVVGMNDRPSLWFWAPWFSKNIHYGILLKTPSIKVVSGYIVSVDMTWSTIKQDSLWLISTKKSKNLVKKPNESKNTKNQNKPSYMHWDVFLRWHMARTGTFVKILFANMHHKQE